MDDAVMRAMLKWPDVPAVFGWLALDQRGEWRLRGERIANVALREFIARNYAGDECGRWYFQNGPQRAFVGLAYTPFVCRLTGGWIVDHCGDPLKCVSGAWMDENGALLLAGGRSVALLDDRDLEIAADCIVGTSGAPLGDALIQWFEVGGAPAARFTIAGHSVPLQPIRRAQVADRFGFSAEPGADQD